MKNGQIKWQRSKNTEFESLDYKDHAVVDETANTQSIYTWW